MRITAYSLTMACIWTSVLTLIMCAVQSNKRTVQYFGIHNILMLYVFGIVRMLVPIEFPDTKIIPVEMLYNAGTILCTKELFGGMFQAGDVILTVWGVGTIICVFRLLKDYQITRQTIHACAVKAEQPAYDLLGELQKDHADQRTIEVYRMPCAVPMALGIIHPVILLPDELYQETDLYYIIRHEYTHILNHDMTVKLLLNLWSCIFWWNPVMYLLYNNIEKALELKCDFITVEKLGQEGRVRYLSAILSAIKNVTDEDEQKKFSKSINALYKIQKQEEILKRFQYVSKYTKLTQTAKAKYHSYIAVMFVLYAIIFCVSYGFVFQSRFDAPMEEVVTAEEMYDLQPDNTFLRMKEGRYEIIHKNECVGTIEKDAALFMLKDGFEIK